MDIVYWGKYLAMVFLGTLLVLLSLRECVETLDLNFKPSNELRWSVRYLGLFLLVYSGYCLIVDVIVFR
jgi:hypothetical protein